MKQSKQYIKIFLYVVVALIIGVGATVIALNGFNVELAYRSNQKIELVIGEIIEDTSKIQEKADEVFGKGNSTVQVVELFKDTVQVTAREISEEQRNSLVEKINELYPQDVKEETNKKIELVIGEEVKDTSKIQAKADEVFGKGNATVKVVGNSKDTVEVTAKEMSEAQKNTLIEKVDKLYTKDVKEKEAATSASQIAIQSTGNAHLRDFLTPYILPIVLATAVVLAYYGIRYRKLGVIKVICKSLLVIVLAELVLISLLAIVRFPMGRLTAPLVLLVYVTSLIYTSGRLIKKEKANI